MIFDEQEGREDATAIVAMDGTEMELWSLVLSAVAIPHFVGSSKDDYTIWVAQDRIHAAQHQIFSMKKKTDPR